MSRRPGGVVVTGGGTAGHVLPALAVAEALVDGGRDRADIQYVGARRGMERRLVTEAGFPLRLLPGRGIERRLSRSSVAAAAALGYASLLALSSSLRRRPEVVLSVGGYAALPYSLAAILLGVPLVIVNVDAVPGAANRLAGRFAVTSAVALPGTPLPRAVLTGAPVRKEALAVERTQEGRARARAALGLPEGVPVVAVTGGSLGARRLNEAGLALARRWGASRPVVLYQVAGDRDLAWVETEAASSAVGERAVGFEHRVVGYEARLPELLAAADVVVARAGAATISELAVIGTPSVLVPLPNAPGDHQRRNAERLADAGAALLLDDGEASGDALADLIEPLLEDPARRAEMERAARSLGRPDAAAQVAALVEEAARTPRREALRVGRLRTLGRVEARP